MKRFSLLLGILVFLGCSTQPKVYVNHVPADSHLLVLQNPETGITLYSQVLKYYVYEEDEESDVWHVSVPKNDKIVLSEDAVKLTHNIRVGNRNKEEYMLIHVFVPLSGDKQKLYVDKTVVYKGSFSRKDFELTIDADGVNEAVSYVEVRDFDHNLLLSSNKIKYERR